MKPLKIVVTGASGFLGERILSLLMAKQNIEVIPVTRKNITGWYGVADYSQSPSGDVLIHLAENNDRAKVAQSGYEYEEEVLATLNALLAKLYRRFIYVSSATLYDDNITRAHFPDDPVFDKDAYTRVKRRSEMAVLKLPTGIVVRLANVYGPGMSKNNVMSVILKQLHKSGSLQLMDTSPVRDFIWVDDVAEGIVSLAINQSEKDSGSRVYNLGTGVGTSIGDLAKMILDVAGQPDRLVKATQKSDRQSSIILDYSDTTEVCGWQPKTSLRDGIEILLQKSKEYL